MDTTLSAPSVLHHRRRSPRAMRILVGLAAATLAAIAFQALRPRPLRVETATVRRGVLRVLVEDDGVTRVHDRWVVTAPLTGTLARVGLHPGDTVRQGQALVAVEPVQPPMLDARMRTEAAGRLAAAQSARDAAMANVERARLAADLAQREGRRMRLLADRQLAPPADTERAEYEASARAMDLRGAQFAADVAAHDVEMARATLQRARSAPRAAERLTLPSPMAGQVLRVLHPGGGVVAAGTPLLEIGVPGTLEVVVDVLSSDAVRIRAGQPATLTRWGGEGPLRAHVRVVEPAAFTRVSALGVEEQRVNVILALDEPDTRTAALGDGFRVDAQIVTAEIPAALQAPSGAAFRRGDGWAAFRIVDGRAQLTEVDLGARSGTDVEVRRGLADGDLVIVHAGDRVRAGVLVTGGTDG
ncbi:MAG: HlyD family efflux transporter periplasmic adaptor subunit [Deltaproteobacteria bacterium]|nr:HlyD family efflux transporter periplasmic adaptor subunit [Deltaproteobacteria bacterium]